MLECKLAYHSLLIGFLSESLTIVNVVLFRENWVLSINCDNRVRLLDRTYWGQYASENYAVIGSNNGLSPDRRQANFLDTDVSLCRRYLISNKVFLMFVILYNMLKLMFKTSKIDECTFLCIASVMSIMFLQFAVKCVWKVKLFHLYFPTQNQFFLLHDDSMWSCTEGLWFILIWKAWIF